MDAIIEQIAETIKQTTDTLVQIDILVQNIVHKLLELERRVDNLEKKTL